MSEDPRFYTTDYVPDGNDYERIHIEHPGRAADNDWRDGVVFEGDDPPAPVPVLIDRLLPKEGITFLGGQSGAGKTFIAVDKALALVSEGEFFGYRVLEKVGVIYIAAEGGATIANRIEAAKRARGITGRLPIAIVKKVPDMTNNGERRKFVTKLQRIAEEIRINFSVRVGVVMIDTIAAAFSIKDENAAGEMTAVAKDADSLGRSIGAATVAVFHYGKDASTGLRGSSGTRAFGESVIAVLAERNELTGECKNRRLVHAKSRIGEEGPISGFELADIKLGVNENGKPFGAAYIKPGVAASFTENGGGKLKDGAQFYLRALDELLCAKGRACRPFGDDFEVKAVTRDDVREMFGKMYPARGDTPEKRKNNIKQRFYQGEKELHERRMIGGHEVDGAYLVWRGTENRDGEA